MTEPREGSGGAQPVHQIGEAAELAGLSLRTIRHYEEIDLVRPSARTTGGFRLYTDADVERLRFVARMKPFEFTLDELRQLLEARDVLADVAADDTARREAHERLAEFAVAAEERCARLRDQLARVEEMSAMLSQEVADGRAPTGGRA